VQLLVFQHIDCEHPGRLRDFLRADGIQWTAVQLDEDEPIPPLENYDALWVMGGPMDVWDVDEHPWLVQEKQAIRHWVREMKRPFLGLCLGHQLLADALGGTCGPQRPPEIGVFTVDLTTEGRADPIFRRMAHRQVVLQWHSVRVAQPPDNAVVLASSPDCRVQAMRVGPRAWSMQYHVEVEEDTVRNWGAIDAYHQALESALGPGAVDSLATETERHLEDFAAAAQQLYRNFMAAAVQ
jgi:GMP synthase-like glutamine amidotransferase